MAIVLNIGEEFSAEIAIPPAHPNRHWQAEKHIIEPSAVTNISQF